MTDDYCELCELARSQCIHGRPPSPPVERRVEKSQPKPRGSMRVAARNVERKWTPHAELRPPILEILREYGGRIEADDLMIELEVRLDSVLTPGDREQTPQGEQRWHTATRRERKALIDDGLLVPARPGVWELTPHGLSTTSG